MFRGGVLYFTNISPGREIVNHQLQAQKGPPSMYQDLVRALESARTRLAVAIAAETKATPLKRWNYYLETADQMRECLRQLRTLPRSAIRIRADWIEALDTLRQLRQRADLRSRPGEAHQLCQRLRAVLDQIGRICD